MNVNEKGNIGLIRVLSDLYAKGFYCFPAFDDFSPIDCIAMNKDGRTFRLQVKYRTPDKNKRYEIRADSMVNGKGVPIDRNLLDFWAVYLADLDKVVYLPIDKMKGKKYHYITRKQLNGEMDEWFKSAPC